MTTTAETTRRSSNSGRRGSMEDQSLASSTGSRLSSTELSAVSNISTRQLLENMDDEQIGKAMEGLKVVRQKRRESAKRTNSITRVSAEASAMADDTNEESAGETSSKADNNSSNNDPDNVTSNDGDDDDRDAGQLDVIPPLPDFGKKKTSNTDSSALSKTSPHNDGRRMSKSLGAMAGIGDHDFSQYVSDSDSDEDGSPNDRKGGSTPPEHFKTMDRGLTKLHEGDEEDRDDDTDDDSENVAKKEFDPAPVRRVRTQRRTAMAKSVGPGTSHTQWKPLSTPTVDEENDDDEDQEVKKEQTKPDTGAGGLGGLWNTFKKSLSGDSHQDSLQETTKPKPDGAKFFRRGKRRAEKCQFLEAVALFNFALINQREELGKNHIDCGRTLNEIGLCWLMMGERYPAMTAFEEALFIFQHNLGDGAQEVAEVTNNIWMVLHEQREEALNL